MYIHTRTALVMAALLLSACNALLGIAQPLPVEDDPDAAGEPVPLGAPMVCSIDGAPQGNPPPAPGALRVVFKSASTAQAESASIEVAEPAYGLQGDFLWLVLLTFDQTTEVIPPDGWRLRGTFNSGERSNRPGYAVWWFHRFAAGGSHVFKLQRQAALASSYAVMGRYSNVDPVEPIADHRIAPATPLGLTSPPVETIRPERLLVFSFVNAVLEESCHTEAPLCGRVDGGPITLGDRLQAQPAPVPPVPAGCARAREGAGSVLVLNLVRP